MQQEPIFKIKIKLNKINDYDLFYNFFKYLFLFKNFKSYF